MEKTEKILTSILSGKHPLAKKYAGKHVLVVKNHIALLKDGKEGRREIEKLKKKFGELPIIVFVPRPEISYILVLKNEKD